MEWRVCAVCRLRKYSSQGEFDKHVIACLGDTSSESHKPNTPRKCHACDAGFITQKDDRIMCSNCDFKWQVIEGGRLA